MTEDIVKKMQEYLATATEEQLAKDYEELVNNHNGPTVDEYFKPNSDSMTKQEFYLQAAAMIAAQLHSNNSAFDDGEECNINTYAVSAASNLLKEVQTEWDNRSKNAKMYGALFQP